MNNFLVITMDALSKWYIDQLKTENSFFEYLENNTYSFQNMYSTGPFTEAAVRGYWSGVNTLEGNSYLSETHFEKETFQEYFSKTHYMYYGELIPYYNYGMKTDNQNKREKCEERAFEHIWSARMSHFCYLYKNNMFKPEDIWKIKLILNEFFEKYSASSDVEQEQNSYLSDPEKYIQNILDQQENSEFYKHLWNPLVDSCRYPKLTSIDNQDVHTLLPEEAMFIKLAKNKNIQIAKEHPLNTMKSLESILSGEKNRCIVSNNDLLEQMRDENEKLPKLREEIDDFLEWYDLEGASLKEPFFAYIHNYDFHYPENFLNSRYEKFDAYQNEVSGLLPKLEKIAGKNISVSKQLCLNLIEENLAFLWNELEKRGVFKNTCVILTADHGISNFMCPVERSNTRWNYTRTNFNVPLYIKAPFVNDCRDERLFSAKDIPQIFQELNQIDDLKKVLLEEKPENRYIFTAWINGIPEIDKSSIKIGIRNNKYSITLEGYFLQSFASLSVNGIYDLIDDPDEFHNIAYADIIENVEFDVLYQALSREWNALVEQIILDHGNGYEFYNRYGTLVNGHSLSVSSKSIYKVSRNEFYNKIAGKKIVIWGTGNKAREFLENMPASCDLIGVVDKSPNADTKKFYGHKINKPTKEQIDQDTWVVVCVNHEIEVMYILMDMKIDNQIYYSSIF